MYDNAASKVLSNVKSAFLCNQVRQISWAVGSARTDSASLMANTAKQQTERPIQKTRRLFSRSHLPTSASTQGLHAPRAGLPLLRQAEARDVPPTPTAYARLGSWRLLSSAGRGISLGRTNPLLAGGLQVGRPMCLILFVCKFLLLFRPSSGGLTALSILPYLLKGSGTWNKPHNHVQSHDW